MKKFAFFVEGLTEQLFIEKLLSEVFNTNQIAIEINRIRGGSSIPISITTITTPTITDITEYYLLIYDCGGDCNIRSYIQDQRTSLLKSGYSKIIGIRDVYPQFTRSEIHDLRYGLYFKLPQRDLPTVFILSIMEIEAWFLAEENHYLKIDNTLTTDNIEKNYIFNPSIINTELRDVPSDDLNNIYKLVGKRYIKENNSISRTVEAIDYANIYFETYKRISSLNDLIAEINSFF